MTIQKLNTYFDDCPAQVRKSIGQIAVAKSNGGAV